MTSNYIIRCPILVVNLQIAHFISSKTSIESTVMHSPYIFLQSHARKSPRTVVTGETASVCTALTELQNYARHAIDTVQSVQT